MAPCTRMTLRGSGSTSSRTNREVKTVLVFCLWFLLGVVCCLGSVCVFSMVAERRRSSGAMVQFLETYGQMVLLLVILGSSMCLHEVWVLSSPHETDSDDFDFLKDVVGTAKAEIKEVSCNDEEADLAAWYRSVAWTAVSGVIYTRDTHVEIYGNRTADVETETGNFHGHEKMVSSSDAMNSTFEILPHSRIVPDIRAMPECRTFNRLNDSHGMQEIADTRGTVGVNELMVCHGMFLLMMYIIEGVLICFSNFVIDKSYGDIACVCISGVVSVIKFLPFRRWKTMSLVALVLMDGASAEGLMHWVWFSLFAVFLLSQVIEHANMRQQNYARLSRKLKRKSHLSQRATRCKCKAIIWLSMIYTAKSMDGQVLNQVAELARAATQAATAATAIASQFSSRGSSSMESAVKVLKSPDTFTGDDSFMNWRTSFVSWIGYGDEKYLKLIPAVEKMAKAPDISTYKEEDKELAHKFYAILSSYLRGRCSSLVRAESENRDGFSNCGMILCMNFILKRSNELSALLKHWRPILRFHQSNPCWRTSSTMRHWLINMRNLQVKSIRVTSKPQRCSDALHRRFVSFFNLPFVRMLPIWI